MAQLIRRFGSPNVTFGSINLTPYTGRPGREVCIAPIGTQREAPVGMPTGAAAGHPMALNGPKGRLGEAAWALHCLAVGVPDLS